MGVKYDEITGMPSNDHPDYNKLLEMWRDEKKKRQEAEGTLGSAQDINDSYQRDISKLQQSVEEVKADLAREKEDRQYDNLVHKQELERHLKQEGSGK